MWAFRIKLKRHGSLCQNILKMDQKSIHYDGWYNSPSTKPIIPDTTAVVLGKVTVVCKESPLLRMEYFMVFGNLRLSKGLQL